MSLRTLTLMLTMRPAARLVYSMLGVMPPLAASAAAAAAAAAFLAAASTFAVVKGRLGLGTGLVAAWAAAAAAAAAALPSGC